MADEPCGPHLAHYLEKSRQNSKGKAKVLLRIPAKSTPASCSHPKDDSDDISENEDSAAPRKRARTTHLTPTPDSPTGTERDSDSDSNDTDHAPPPPTASAFLDLPIPPAPIQRRARGKASNSKPKVEYERKGPIIFLLDSNLGTVVRTIADKLECDVDGIDKTSLKWRYESARSSDAKPFGDADGMAVLRKQIQKDRGEKMLVIQLAPPRPTTRIQTQERAVDDNYYSGDEDAAKKGTIDDGLKPFIADLFAKYKVGDCPDHPMLHCYYSEEMRKHFDLGIPPRVSIWALRISEGKATMTTPPFSPWFHADKALKVGPIASKSSPATTTAPDVSLPSPLTDILTTNSIATTMMAAMLHKLVPTDTAVPQPPRPATPPLPPQAQAPPFISSSPPKGFDFEVFAALTGLDERCQDMLLDLGFEGESILGLDFQHAKDVGFKILEWQRVQSKVEKWRIEYVVNNDASHQFF